MTHNEIGQYLSDHLWEIQAAANTGNQKAQRVIETVGMLFESQNDHIPIRQIRDLLSAQLAEYLEELEAE